MTTRSRSNQPNSNQGLGILSIIALICVSISFVQTALGYELLAGPIFTWLFSLVISAFMLLSNFRLFDALQNRKSIMGILIFYCIIAFFSFAGNFNAFYTQFMREEIYERELRDCQQKIHGIKEKGITTIQEQNDASEFETKVKNLQTKLRIQITDPNNPGIGREAKIIIADINQVLGTDLTPVAGSPSDQARGMDMQIEEILKAQMKQKQGRAPQLVAEINADVDSIMPSIAYALQPGNIKTEGRNTLLAASAVHNKIGQKVQGAISSFQYQPIKVHGHLLGRISESFRSAFVEKQNPQATTIASLASLAIDFLVPIYLFLTVKRRVEDEEDGSIYRQPGNSNSGIEVV